MNRQKAFYDIRGGAVEHENRRVVKERLTRQRRLNDRRGERERADDRGASDRLTLRQGEIERSAEWHVHVHRIACHFLEFSNRKRVTRDNGFHAPGRLRGEQRPLDVVYEKRPVAAQDRGCRRLNVEVIHTVSWQHHLGRLMRLEIDETVWTNVRPFASAY